MAEGKDVLEDEWGTRNSMTAGTQEETTVANSGLAGEYNKAGKADGRDASSGWPSGNPS
jgi:hypothetical protein